MSARRFRQHLRESPALRSVAQRYALTFMNQTARSSACNRMHEIHQRLARWLLLVHDRDDYPQMVAEYETVLTTSPFDVSRERPDYARRRNSVGIARS
ncbi:MAG: hypothetical protein LC797_20805 [Chloroflexi bacterium]|nr:hypothetical protein [Chloroflexota bacterium]